VSAYPVSTYLNVPDPSGCRALNASLATTPEEPALTLKSASRPDEADLAQPRPGGTTGFSGSLLDLGDPHQQVADLIAIELGDRRDPVNIADQVLGRPEERLTEAIGSDHAIRPQPRETRRRSDASWRIGAGAGTLDSRAANRLARNSHAQGQRR
jgi:hypothetical protein